MYFAARDPRTPMPVRVLAILVAAYALSPIDLIPDFIPVIGYLDDLLIVPLGLALVVRLTPPRFWSPPAPKRSNLQASRSVMPPRAASCCCGWWWLVVAWISARWIIGVSGL